MSLLGFNFGLRLSQTYRDRVFISVAWLLSNAFSTPGGTVGWRVILTGVNSNLGCPAAGVMNVYSRNRRCDSLGKHASTSSSLITSYADLNTEIFSMSLSLKLLWGFLITWERRYASVRQTEVNNGQPLCFSSIEKGHRDDKTERLTIRRDHSFS